jgi:cell wall assembly regulator SMI1
MSTQNNNWRKQIFDYSRVLAIITGIASGAFVFAGYDLMMSLPESSSTTEFADSKPSAIIAELPTEQIVEIFANTEVKPQSAEPTAEIKLPENVKAEVEIHSVNKAEPEVYNYQKKKSQKLSNLESFVAVCSNQLISVSWITEGSRVEDFEVEVSTDNVTFEKLEEKAVVVSVDNKNYFKLKVPETSTDSKYFRLKKIADAKTIQYSEVAEASCLMSNNDPVIDVYPAGNGKFKVVVIAKKDDKFKVVITDMNETELVTDEFKVKTGTNEFVFRSGLLPRGSYNLKVTNGTIVSSKIVAIK